MPLNVKVFVALLIVESFGDLLFDFTVSELSPTDSEGNSSDDVYVLILSLFALEEFERVENAIRAV